MTDTQQNQLLLYGRPGCPMVPPVRALLDEAGVAYTYRDIRQDVEAAVQLRHLTGGYESVPTVVLPGGRVLVEPGVMTLRRALAEAELGDMPGTAGTLKAGLSNPVYPILLLIALALIVAVAVAVLFAREGADVAIVYLNEHGDAEKTAELIKAEGGRCRLISGDVGDAAFCQEAIKKTVKELGGLNILVNNAAEQHEQKKLEDITPLQLERTFRTNIFGYFYMAQAALPHLSKGDAIINTASVTAYRGSPHLVDYSATKGANVVFTRSLATQLAKRKTGIRVNGVAPGPIWTPLIPASFDADKVDEFGADVPLGRPGQPEEVAPAYVYLACEADSSYVNGQIIHVNGGEIVNA